MGVRRRAPGLVTHRQSLSSSNGSYGNARHPGFGRQPPPTATMGKPGVGAVFRRSNVCGCVGPGSVLLAKRPERVGLRSYDGAGSCHPRSDLVMPNLPPSIGLTPASRAPARKRGLSMAGMPSLPPWSISFAGIRPFSRSKPLSKTAAPRQGRRRRLKPGRSSWVIVRNLFKAVLLCVAVIRHTHGLPHGRSADSSLHQLSEFRAPIGFGLVKPFADPRERSDFSRRCTVPAYSSGSWLNRRYRRYIVCDC